MKRRGLGRGLGALLGDSGAATAEEQFLEIPLHQVVRGRYQPRRDMKTEALEELAASIRAQGVMQPVVVRSEQGGTYELIAGERRWRAAQLAGLATIPAMIRHVPDETALALALIENVQRENLNPVEEAAALKRLQDEFNMTQQEVADAVGKSRVTVTNLMRLLNLEDAVREMLEQGLIEMGHARALLGANGLAQVQLANAVIAQGLSVRETENLVRRAAQTSQVTTRRAAHKDPDVARLELQLSEHLGAPVALEHGAKGAGRLIVRYGNLDELDAVLRHLRLPVRSDDES